MTTSRSTTQSTKLGSRSGSAEEAFEPHDARHHPFASKTPDRAAPDKPPLPDSKTSPATLMGLFCSLAVLFLLHSSRGEKCAKIRPPIPSSLKVAFVYVIVPVPDEDKTPRLTAQKGRDGTVQTEEGVRECSSGFSGDYLSLPVTRCFSYTHASRKGHSPVQWCLLLVHGIVQCLWNGYNPQEPSVDCG